MAVQSPKYPNNLREAIKRAGWKVYQVAEETGIPEPTLKDYSAGKAPIPKERLLAISRCLRYPTGYLVPHLHDVRVAYLSQSEDEQAQDAQTILALQTHLQARPTDEDALRELMILLGRLGRYNEIEQCYTKFLKRLNQTTSSGPDPRTSHIFEHLRAQKALSASSLALENAEQAASANDTILPETATHPQEASAPPKADGPSPLVPLTSQTSPSINPQPPASSSFFNGSTQGIIISGDANAHSLNARNQRDNYLASSTDTVPSLRAYSTLCQGEATVCQQQIDIYKTIKLRRTMNDEHNPYQITRRDLITLATVSPSLLINIRRGWLTAGVIEEFLSEATASMTTCWYLLQSDGLPIVELTLPQYLPELVEVVKFSSLYRQRAAYLAAQGFLLLGLVAHHRVRFAEHVAYCQEAVTYAHESGDPALLVASLEHLSSALLTNGDLDESLRTYLQAKGYSESAETSGLSRSMVLAGLSPAYAKQGKSQEALRCLGEARTLFTEPDDETPVFLRAANDLYQIIREEGRSSLALGNHAKDQNSPDRARKYWKDAAEKFGKIEQLPSGIVVPVRIAAEVAIARALAYAKAKNMEGFLTAFEKGAKLAMELGSEKRKQEAREALNEALEQWPNDQRITGLWQLLI